MLFDDLSHLVKKQTAGLFVYRLNTTLVKVRRTRERFGNHEPEAFLLRVGHCVRSVAFVK